MPTRSGPSRTLRGGSSLDPIAVTSSTEEQLLQAGVLYTGGGKVTVTNNTAVLQLSNPAGSGKRIIVARFYLASDTTIDASFFKNATVDAPTVRTSDPLKLDSGVPPAVGVLRTGVTGYSVAGTPFSATARLLADITVDFPIPLSLPPGTSLYPRHLRLER